MEKQAYQSAEMEIIKFGTKDAIVTSGDIEIPVDFPIDIAL